MKKIFILITTLLCLLTGCSFQNKELDFNINNDFKIINTEHQKDKYILTIKSEKDIDEFIHSVKKTYSREKINLEIKLFHTDAKNTEFDIENLKDFRELDYYNSYNNFYISKTYTDLPLIKDANKLSEFENKSVKETENKIKISITMKNTSDLSEMISELKIYINLVKQENKTNKTIEITVNNKYIYDGKNYLIIQKKVEI